MNTTNTFLKHIVLVLMVLIAFSFTTNQTQQKGKSIDKNLLLGNWVRTDADYKIKISEVAKDGKLKAGYFNPKSINVSKATWTNSKGILKIFIELRDENYPGSTYTLRYYPEKDMLAGTYFQAVTGETFDILFSRVK